MFTPVENTAVYYLARREYIWDAGGTELKKFYKMVNALALYDKLGSLFFQRQFLRGMQSFLRFLPPPSPTNM